jgi:hypothetical protein
MKGNIGAPDLEWFNGKMMNYTPGGDSDAEGVFKDRESNTKFLSKQEEECGMEIAAACTSFERHFNRANCESL